MGIMDKLHDAVFEEDEQAPKRVNAIPAAPPSARPIVTAPDNLSLTSIPDSDPIYQTLLECTDPRRTSPLTKVYDLAAPLEKIIADPALRMRAAFAQSGVTASAAEDTVTMLLDALDKEKERFNAGRNVFSQSIGESRAELASLQLKVTQLAAKVKADEDALNLKDKSFAEAYRRRQLELNDLKRQFSIL